MTLQEPIETPHGWLTLNNRHTSERLLIRRVLRDGEMWLELKGTLPPNQDGPPLHIHELYSTQIVGGLSFPLADQRY